MACHGGEILYAPSVLGIENLWESAFSEGVKFLIDLMYALMFSFEYELRMGINKTYEDLGAETFWNLTSKDLFSRPE